MLEVSIAEPQICVRIFKPIDKLEDMYLKKKKKLAVKIKHEWWI